MRWLMVGILWVLVGLACATTKVAGECPESENLRCMTRKICDQDKQRGCMVCTCESAWESDRIKAGEDVKGPPPP